MEHFSIHTHNVPPHSELEVIAALDTAPVQIAFEVHLSNAYKRFKGHVTLDQWEAMWTKLDSLSYRVHNHELNPGCRCCCEYSLIRADAL